MDAWNVWWTDYGNTPEGFAELRERVESAANGREVAATAAVMVKLPGHTGRASAYSESRGLPLVEGSPEDIAAHITAMADAGASHVQLVADPITLESVEWLGQVLTVLDNA